MFCIFSNSNWPFVKTYMEATSQKCALNLGCVYDKTVQNLLIQPNDLFVQCRENSSLTNYGLWGFFRTIIFHMNTPTIRADDVALNNSKEKVN